MSAQQGAPVLGRAQVATPTLWNAPQGSSIPAGSAPARMTRRAIAVAAATLCAPLVAMLGLAAIGAAIRPRWEPWPARRAFAGAR